MVFALLQQNLSVQTHIVTNWCSMGEWRKPPLVIGGWDSNQVFADSMTIAARVLNHCANLTYSVSQYLK